MAKPDLEYRLLYVELAQSLVDCHAWKDCKEAVGEFAIGANRSFGCSLVGWMDRIIRVQIANDIKPGELVLMSTVVPISYSTAELLRTAHRRIITSIWSAPSPPLMRAPTYCCRGMHCLLTRYACIGMSGISGRYLVSIRGSPMRLRREVALGSRTRRK